MDIFTLVRAAKLLHEPEPRRPPDGPMAAFVGPQLSADDVAAAYGNRTDGDELPSNIAQAVRAFPVAALAGVTFTCLPDGFHAELDQALAAALPGTTWRTGSMARGGPGLVEKYGLLDGWYATGPDEATGQLMVLCLAGDAGMPGRTWEPGLKWNGDIAVKITTATWCNVGGLGFGVGFYM